MDAAVRDGGRGGGAEAGVDEQKGAEPPAEDGTGLSVQIPELSQGLHGGNPTAGPRGPVEHRAGAEVSTGLTGAEGDAGDQLAAKAVLEAVEGFLAAVADGFVRPGAAVPRGEKGFLF